MGFQMSIVSNINLDTRNFYIAHVIDSFFSGGSFCLPLY